MKSVVHLFLLNRKDMSLTSILSAEAIENAVKDCQGIISVITLSLYSTEWNKEKKNISEQQPQLLSPIATTSCLLRSGFNRMMI